MASIQRLHYDEDTIKSSIGAAVGASINDSYKVDTLSTNDKKSIVVNKGLTRQEFIGSSANRLVANGSALADLFTNDERSIDEIANDLYNSYSRSNNMISSQNGITNDINSASNIVSIIDTISNAIDTGLDTADEWLGDLDSTIDETLSNTVVKGFLSKITGNSKLTQLLKSTATNIVTSLMTYKDGISETSFGAKMEDSWQGISTENQNNRGEIVMSFLNYFKTGQGSRQIKILKSTPLDSGKERSAVYGSMILGTPFLFNDSSDPDNRAMINTFVKDARYLSLTPGMPKYYGSSQMAKNQDNILSQTTHPDEMLSYLLKNGIDSDFVNKDKRYYTFKADYVNYFSYLETMLNAVWVKLGLGTENDSSFNLFTFFKINENGSTISPEKYADLKEQYKSSIGFFCDPSGAISEDVSSSQTGFGSELKGVSDAYSDTFQKINYITGMGTGSGTQNMMRKVALGANQLSNLNGAIADVFEKTNTLWSSSKKWYAKLIGSLYTIPADLIGMGTEKDMGAIAQSFATTNGMKTMYPELWSDSSYSKNINLNFSFVSPYGDPLSIFKYVYVPFCAMLCFTLPRQAADNAYVSPFFVRADIPGILSCDLGLISSMTWTKGGANNLWTKDGLPRAIDVSITISDLYPYLAMTKRLSYLSANPSYTVFLDNMAGMCALNDGTTDDYMNEYFQNLINRISGDRDSGKLWNSFNSAKRQANTNFGAKANSSISSNSSKFSVPWMHNSSL